MKISFIDDTFIAAAKFLKKNGYSTLSKSEIIETLKNVGKNRSKSGCDWTDFDGVYVAWNTCDGETTARALIDADQFLEELEIDGEESSDIIEELTEYIEDNFNVGEKLSYSEMIKLKSHLEEVIMKLEDLGA